MADSFTDSCLANNAEYAETAKIFNNLPGVLGV